MGRVFKLETVGKERKRMTQGLVLALRELIKQSEPGSLTRDLAAFIAITLLAIWETIDPSVAAWEKRGYWVKADRFRMEWNWTQRFGEQLRIAVIDENWGEVAMIAAKVMEKVQGVHVPQHHKLGTPWLGARDRL